MSIRILMAGCALGVLAACAAGAPVNEAQAPSVVEPAEASPVTVSDAGITVIPTAEGAAPVRLVPVSPTIIRVLADPDGDFVRDESLMIVEQAAFTDFSVDEGASSVTVETEALSASVDYATGMVTFRDADGKVILSEYGERRFSPFTLEGEEFYAIQQNFDSDRSEGFFGLGQHQMGQMNYNGENVELAQHNVSIAMPFVVSTGDYGILWDQSSITRFGDPRPWQGLDETLIVRGEDGSEGGLTGRYYVDEEVVAETREGDPDFEFLPEDQFATGTSVREVFPQPLGTTSPDLIVWTGSIEAETAGLHKFQVYGSSYITVTVDGEVVVDRWRQNWNPYQFNFELEMAPGEAKDIRIEWVPNDGYFKLRHLDPRMDGDPQQLTLSSEVAQLMDYYFIHGKTADDVIAGYRDLTGDAVMLPRWAYGFWQSRQRYTTAEELVDVVEEYRARGIGLDNIVLDWFYWPEDAWGSHDFDAPRFPDPAGMVDAVHDLNANIMISVWPKFYPTTDNYKELDAKGCIYTGNIDRGALDWVGPGYLNAFVDQYSQECRDIFWRQMQEKLDTKGFDAWWMDATEPDMHSNVSAEDRAYRMGPTAMGPALQYYNSFVLMNSRAVYEGERSGTDPNQRVFILTRSGFPGLQRYGSASWSGDVVARWDDLREQISAGVNISLAGLPNWTHDIGGFSVEARYTNEDPDHIEEWRELNLRWFQFGAFTPIFRSHGEYPTREIFNLAPEGSEVYESLVKYNRLRYRLMPYIYTLAADTFQKDGTIMRGLVMDFEADREAWDIDDQYMFGPAFLVSPVHEFRARERKLYLPAGADWYDFHTGAKQTGGQWITADAPLSDMPLFVRAGSIVPMGEDIEYTGQKPDGRITLYVYRGADGDFSLYQDDGLSYDYEDGEWSRIPINFDEEERTLTLGALEGTYRDGEAREIGVVFVDGTGEGFSFDAEPDVVFPYVGKPIVVLAKK